MAPSSHGDFHCISTGACGFCVSRSIRSVNSNVTGESTGTLSDSVPMVISGYRLRIVTEDSA